MDEKEGFRLSDDRNEDTEEEIFKVETINRVPLQTTKNNSKHSPKAKYFSQGILAILISFIVCFMVARELYGQEAIVSLFLSFPLLGLVLGIILSRIYISYREEIRLELSKSERYLYYGISVGSFIVLVLSVFINSIFDSYSQEYLFISQGCGFLVLIFFILPITIILQFKDERRIMGFLTNYRRANPGRDHVEVSEVASVCGLSPSSATKILGTLMKLNKVDGFIFNDGMFYFNTTHGRKMKDRDSFEPREKKTYDLNFEPHGGVRQSTARRDGLGTQALSNLKSYSGQKEEIQRVLSSIVAVRVPAHVDSGTVAEIFVSLNNTTSTRLEDVSLDLSDLEEFFEVEGDMKVASLRPGMELEGAIKIKPLFSKGTFPVNISVTGNGVRITRNETIKVGGTEVY